MLPSCLFCPFANISNVGFVDEHALILYVYLQNYDGADESVLTVSCSLLIVMAEFLTFYQYYISSFSV